jgi:hypothetical protein
VLSIPLLQIYTWSSIFYLTTTNQVFVTALTSLRSHPPVRASFEILLSPASQAGNLFSLLQLMTVTISDEQFEVFVLKQVLVYTDTHQK